MCALQGTEPFKHAGQDIREALSKVSRMLYFARLCGLAVQAGWTGSLWERREYRHIKPENAGELLEKRPIAPEHGQVEGPACGIRPCRGVLPAPHPDMAGG